MIVPRLMAAQLAMPQALLAHIDTWAQVAIERAINSLPEGILVTLFAWAALRVLPKQNSRTRFAVWFLALLAVIGRTCLGGLMRTELHGGIVGASSIAPAKAYAIHLPPPWSGYLFIAWLIAASVAMTRLAVGLLHLRKLLQSCTPVDAAGLHPSILRAFDELNRPSSLGSRRVTLATSERVRVPAALGLWKPIIVLPTWALDELPPDDLTIIVHHEFAHLRRWDDWTNLLQKIVRALLFFHPAVWWIEDRLSVEREMACDDIVVAQTDNPMGYASCLVSLLERSLAQRGWTMAQAIVHRAREASLRLAQILDKNRPAATGISKPALGLVGTFAVLCVAILPQTPHFVAFDRTPLPAPVDHEYSAALVHPATFQNAHAQASFHPAAVIPAALTLGQVMTGQLKTGPQMAGKLKSNMLNTDEQTSQQENSGSAPALPALAQLAPASREVLAQSNLRATRDSLIDVSASADQNSHPMMQTLFFVEATMFVPAEDESSDLMFARTPANSTPTRMIWRVQVWQVTFVAPMWPHSARVPVANKT